MSKTVGFKIYAFITAVLLVLTAGFINTPAAWATDKVVIDNIKITGDKQLRVWDRTTVEWNWSAPQGVTDGETFTIKFPSVLRLGDSLGIDLQAQDGTVGGTCIARTATNNVVCTFNDKFVGKDNVHGTINITADAKERTTEEQVSFEVNGSTTLVRLPGPNGGIEGPNVGVPQANAKNGWFYEDNKHARWRLILLGKDLAKLGNSPITITDSLSLVAGPVKHKFISKDLIASEYDSSPGQLENPASGTNLSLKQTIAADGQSQTIVMNAPAGGWKADRFYYLAYTSVPENDQITAIGTTLSNKATVEGAAINLNATLVRTQSGSGTITGVERGTFEIKKVHDKATQPAELKDGTPFTVTVTIDSPNDAFDKTYDVQVPLNGAVVKGDVALPAGTKVSLKEKLPANDAQFTYGAPKFAATTAGDAAVTINGDTANITIDPARNVGVTLTNTVTAKPQFGAVKLVKKLIWKDTGVAFTEDNPAAKTFQVDYTCSIKGTEVKKGTTAVKGDGAEVTIADLPIGADCSFTEQTPAPIAGVNWVDHHFHVPGVGFVSKTNPITIDAATVPVVTLTNKYRKAVGQFKITKALNATGVTIPATKKFSFNYTCTKDGAVLPEHNNKKLEVTGAGSVTSPNIPVGAKCTVTEDLATAAVEGATMTAVVGDPVTIAVNTVPVVNVTNTYIKDEGAFTITKKVVDPDKVAAGKTFSFAYVCTAAGKPEITGELKDIAAGQSKTSPKIPAGYACKITETGANVADADLKTTGLNDVTIVKNDTKTVEVVNEYAAWKGVVKLDKALAGTGKDLPAVKNHEFSVAYTCVKGGKTTKEGKLTVKAGVPVEVKDVPVGSECSFVEDKAKVNIDGVIFNEVDSTTTATATMSAKDAVAAAALVNSYDELGAVAVTKAVKGTAAGSSDSAKEYTIIAEWTQNGKTESKEFKVKSGETFTDLPKLPVGTKINLKEKLLEGNIFHQWETPGYASDTKDAVKDNGDGTAVVTVQPGTIAKATLVKITNTTNIPWYWLLVPLIPLAIQPPAPGNNVPPAPGNNVPATPAQCLPVTPGQPTPPNPNNLPLCECTTTNSGTNANGQQANGTNNAANNVNCVGTSVQAQAPATAKNVAQQTKPQSKGLANTGASVLGFLVAALVIVGIGAALIVRSRRRNNS